MHNTSHPLHTKPPTVQNPRSLGKSCIPVYDPIYIKIHNPKAQHENHSAHLATQSHKCVPERAFGERKIPHALPHN